MSFVTFIININLCTVVNYFAIVFLITCLNTMKTNLVVSTRTTFTGITKTSMFINFTGPCYWKRRFQKQWRLYSLKEVMTLLEPYWFHIHYKMHIVYHIKKINDAQICHVISRLKKIRSLNSTQAFHIKCSKHMLLKFEQNCLVQTTRDFEYFEETQVFLIIFSKRWRHLGRSFRG